MGGKQELQKIGINTNKYVASFLGVASIEEPELVILVTLYNPTGEEGHQGGGVAAPLGGEILNEVLPYLEVEKTKEEELEIKEDVVMPNVIGKSIEEVEKELKELNLNVEIVNEIEDSEVQEINKAETFVRIQIPVTGISVKEGTTVYVEY